MSSWTPILVLGVTVGSALAEVFSYECDSLPTDAAWSVGISFCDPFEWVDAGRFFQRVEFCEGTDPPAGQQSSYLRSLDDFIGEPAFHFEWRMRTDGDRSEIPWAAPAVFAAGSNGAVNYGFTIASDQVKLNRDNRLPIIFVDIEAGVLHTFRLELLGAELYIWYIDGEIVDTGVPEGAYPSSQPRIRWGAKSKFYDSTAEWDYIRYGTIPIPGSGDFDSDEDMDLRDFYFFDECLANGGPDVEAGPGCLWADMDQDDDVDFHDFALFQLAFTGSE